MTKINSEGTQQKANSSKTITKRDQEINNPCLEEHLMSMKCLSNNDYVQLRCEPYFDNYRLCKKFWSVVVRDRKSKGIEPHLPLPEDRKAVKAEYIKTFVFE
ncbi:coiled-coil-helix-coiled-coil-helix domain-containing protein 7 isoform X2 [Augochlora pura]